MIKSVKSREELTKAIYTIESLSIDMETSYPIPSGIAKVILAVLQWARGDVDDASFGDFLAELDEVDLRKTVQ